MFLCHLLFAPAMLTSANLTTLCPLLLLPGKSRNLVHKAELSSVLLRLRIYAIDQLRSPPAEQGADMMDSQLAGHRWG